MIYSVYDPGRKVYKYYQTPDFTEEAPNPSHLRGNAIGVGINEALWPLPVDARPIGEGEFPRGQIARAGGPALGDVGQQFAALDPGVKALLLVFAGAILYKTLVRGR